MDFTLRQLEYFVAVASHGSITGAAAQCSVSPGAVSLGITELEAQLGHRLLTRSRSRGTTLTSEGQSLLPYARKIFGLAIELDGRSRDLSQSVVGRLTIGCAPTVSPFMLPFLAAAFSPSFPQLTLRFVEASPDELQARMLDGELDCVLMQERQRIEGVRLVRIKDGTPQVILSGSHRFANLEAVSLHELVDEPMVLLSIPAVRRTLLSMLGGLGVTPRPVWLSSQIETVRAMVARGLGWSILIQNPPTPVSYEGLPVLRKRIIEPIGKNDLCLGVPEDEAISHRIKVLIEHLRRHAAAPPQLPHPTEVPHPVSVSAPTLPPALLGAPGPS